jgi:hypothetical protein
MVCGMSFDYVEKCAVPVSTGKLLGKFDWCRYFPNRRCYRDWHCDIFENGFIKICEFHPNPNGLFTRKKIRKKDFDGVFNG